MDFAFLPPEVNSARMYCGPESGPLLAAAAGWDSLAVELTTAADSYESVLSNLTSLDWQGPAAAAMAATATPYADWLRQTARLAKQAARQAWAVAAAYEQAWTSTVPPAAIDANRTRQRSLIATNYAGQNTAAIAATEAQYADFWAQDTAAMSGYETSCAAATAQLTPFPSPDPTTNAEAPAVQKPAVARAVTDAAATNFDSTGAVCGRPDGMVDREWIRPQRFHRARRHPGGLRRDQLDLQLGKLRHRNYRGREQFGSAARRRRCGGGAGRGPRRTQWGHRRNRRRREPCRRRGAG